MTLEINPRSLSLVAQDGTRSITEGKYGLVLDEGVSPQAPAPEATFHIHGAATLPR